MTKIKKVFKFFALVIISLTLLSVFSYWVTLSIQEGDKLGQFTKPINKFALFPKTVLTVLSSNELRGIPPNFIEKDPTFKNVNKLTYDLFGLNSFYSMKKNQWEIKLFNFYNDSIIYKWHLKEEFFNSSNVKRKYRSAALRNSILLADRSLIVGCDETYNLFKLDKNSNIVWHNTSKIYHHGLNLDIDGDIWICSSATSGFRDERNDRNLFYRDDFITKISVETGEILYDKSVSEILIENGYVRFVYGRNHYMQKIRDTDPIHLNDIEPVYFDSEYWKKGDLFLSSRGNSLVFLYRPSTNKIIHFLLGPFLHQHDVDIISENEISIFNNNCTGVGSENLNFKHFGKPVNVNDSLFTSEIIIYNFEDSTYRKHLQHHFDNEKIYSYSQGFQEKLSSGDTYVESQNDGKIYIMNDDEIIYKRQFSTSLENMIERPNWIRIYEHINF